MVQQVYRDSQHLSTVEHETPQPLGPQTDDNSAQSSPPKTHAIDNGGPSLSLGTSEWSSPAFSRRSRHSLGPLSISTFDPFAEEDGYVPGKGRKRTRFSRLSSEWTFAETSPSPTKATNSDPFEDFDIETKSPDVSQSAATRADLGAAPDGVPDNLPEPRASPTLSDSESESVQNASKLLDISDTQVGDVQDSITPKIVVQSEEQEASKVQAISDKDTLSVVEPDLSDRTEELESSIPYPIVTESGSFAATDVTGSTEPVSVGTPENRATETPRLRPIDSSGLPLVSPLNTRSGTPVDHIHEYESTTTSHVTEEIAFPASGDVEMTDLAFDEGEPSLSQQLTQFSESPEAVELPTTSYDQATTHDANENLQGSNSEQISEAAVENTLFTEPISAVSLETTRYTTFGEQTFERNLQVTGDEFADLEEPEREDDTVSTSSEDQLVKVDGDTLRMNDDESGDSSGDSEEYSDEHYEAESDQERVESGEDLPNMEDEPEVSDGEYELDDVAPPPIPQIQSTTDTFRHEVIVLDSDEESPPGAQNEGVKQDEIESPTSDAEEQPEEYDIGAIGAAEGIEVSQSYISEAQDFLGAELEGETEEYTHLGRRELVEHPGSPAIAGTDIAPSKEISEEPVEFSREVSYNRSPSFSPSSRAGSISGRESVEGEIPNPHIFRMQSSESPQSPPPKKQKPSGLSLDGPSSPPPVGTRQNPLFGVRSPSFLKDQPLTPIASQEVPYSPSQQLQYSLGELPTLPTPEASQDVMAAYPPQDSIITAKRGLNESSIENRINIFKDFRLQNSAEASGSQPVVETHPQEETQPELTGNLEVNVQMKNDSQAEAESLPEPDFLSAKESQPDEHDERGVLGHQPDSKTQPELAVESESDVSASQPEASTSPETTLVPEISDDICKPEKRPVNGEQEDIKNDEASNSKDSPRETADPDFLAPYPAKISKPEPNRNATGLRTNLSYYAPLSALVDNFNTLVDTLSIVLSASQPLCAKSGARDYYTTIQLTDRSLGGRTTSAQIFRKYKRAIPRPAEGDVILLRNFKVCAFNHTMMLQSVNSSSWAVFDQGKPDSMKTTGPPVEVGDEERDQVTELRKLYVEGVVAASERGPIPTSRASTATFSTASSESGATENRTRGGSTPRRSRRGKSSGSRRVTVHELRRGRRYTSTGSGSDKDSIHELRDGTVYVNP